MARPSVSPLAEVDPRFIRRRKLLAGIAVCLIVMALIVSGALIRSCVITRSIRQSLRQVVELSCSDTVEMHAEAVEIIDNLYEKYPEHEAIRDRYAWQHLLAALRLGPAEPHVAAARAAVENVESEASSPLLQATRAGLQLFDGDAEAVTTTSRAILEKAPTCRECGYVYALGLVATGRINESVAILDRTRRGRPPFVPALSTLTELLRVQGRYNEARNALNLLAKISPDHTGGIIESALVDIEVASLEPSSAAKVVSDIEKRISNVKVDERFARRAALLSYTQGRLKFLKGEYEAAIAELGKALSIQSGDTAAATWRARALRKMGRHSEAIESLSSFPNTTQTDAALLRTRAEILLDIHKTTDAAEPIVFLLKMEVTDAQLLEGRRLAWAGQPLEAEPFLKTALKQGSTEAAIELSEIYIALGRAHIGKNILDSQRKSDAIGHCAAGFSLYHHGATEKSRQSFDQAAKAGALCGYSLGGRLLVGTGQDEYHLKGLELVLNQREDLRDRVALARLLFRVNGVEEARRELDRVRQLAPQGAVVLGELSEAYSEIGATKESLEVAQEAIKRTNGHPKIFALAARLARENGKINSASGFVKRGLAQSPTSPSLLVEQAVLLFEQRRYPLAEEIAEKIVTPGDHFAEAACLYAEIIAERGDHRESQTQLAKAINRNQRHVGFVETSAARACLALSYVHRGTASYGKAQAQLRFMRRRGMLWAENHYISGIIFGLQSKIKRAETSFRRALELDVAHYPSWVELERHQVLEEADFLRFQKMWPGKRPSEVP